MRFGLFYLPLICQWGERIHNTLKKINQLSYKNDNKKLTEMKRFDNFMYCLTAALAIGFVAWTIVLLTFDLINFLHSLIQ